MARTIKEARVTLNNASDYRTNGHYRTPIYPNPNPSPLVH